MISTIRGFVQQYGRSLTYVAMEIETIQYYKVCATIAYKSSDGLKSYKRCLVPWLRSDCDCVACLPAVTERSTTKGETIASYVLRVTAHTYRRIRTFPPGVSTLDL